MTKVEKVKKTVLAAVVVLIFSVFFSGCGNDKSEQAEKSKKDGDINLEEQTEESYMTGEFSLAENSYAAGDGKKVNGKTLSLIENAKDNADKLGYGDCDFNNAEIEIIEDEFNFRTECIVRFKRGEKTVSVSFREDNGRFIKFSGGDITSEGDRIEYPSNDVDRLLNLAKSYYEILPVIQGYEICSWQTDFSGPDWQVDFARRVDGVPDEKKVYNYSECVRMRISGHDGKLLTVNVFDTPLNTDNTDGETIGYEEALEKTGEDKNKLVKSYIGCYTLRDKGYARVCRCFEFDYSADSGVCDTVTVYIDLYTGEKIGEEGCR